jgi:hypothetical protein
MKEVRAFCMLKVSFLHMKSLSRDCLVHQLMFSCCYTECACQSTPICSCSGPRQCILSYAKLLRALLHGSAVPFEWFWPTFVCASLLNGSCSDIAFKFITVYLLTRGTWGETSCVVLGAHRLVACKSSNDTTEL